MKKLTSMVLTVLIILSLCIVAFAAETNELVLGETKTVTLAVDEELIYTFSPQFEGNYKISVESGAKCFVDITVSNENNVLSTGAIIATDVKNFKGYNIKDIIKPLEHNKEMYVTVKTGSTISVKLCDKTTFAGEVWENSYAPSGLISCFTPSTVSVTVELADLETVKADEKVTITDEAIFSFVPTCTGKHVLLCETIDSAEPEIEIYDCNGNVVVQGDGKEFTAELVAGENYIIKCRNVARSGYDASILSSYTFEIKHIHTFGEWESNGNAKLFRNGTETRICVCGAEEVREDDDSAIIVAFFIAVYNFIISIIKLKTTMCS